MPAAAAHGAAWWCRWCWCWWACAWCSSTAARCSCRAGKRQLEQRVREATAEIERNFRQLAELKVEQVTERERKRIAADLHDDLGAKLLTIVHTSESDRISTLAREALEEMRLSVRGLTGKAVRLADALGDWRAEVIVAPGQAGIEASGTPPRTCRRRCRRAPTCRPRASCARPPATSSSTAAPRTAR
jgi:signal transduction histidine kinase